MFDGGRVIAGAVLDRAQVAREVGVARILGQCHREVVARAVELAAMKVREPQLGVRLGGVERTQLGEGVRAPVVNQFLQHARGFVVVTFVEQTNAAVIMVARGTAQEPCPERQPSLRSANPSAYVRRFG